MFQETEEAWSPQASGVVIESADQAVFRKRR